MSPKDTPIPDMTEMQSRRRGARAYGIRLDAAENAESAIDIRAHGIAGDNYYYREDNPPYNHRAPAAIPELYVREGVLRRLQKLNGRLADFNLELYVYDAYRPVELQNYFHDDWVPAYLRAEHPMWSDETIRDEVGKYWAKGAPSSEDVDPRSPPPHATGGVVDLTLRDRETHEELFMGGPFDGVTELSFVDHFEKESERRPLTEREDEARTNRRILYWAMTEAGFTVNPNEWWHYGFGDQLSAALLRAPHAVYSVMSLSEKSS